MLLEKVTQLEDLCVKKEKFIQSNKMILKFREGHITRLEKLHKEARGSFLIEEQDEFFQEVKEEMKILREQVVIFDWGISTLQIVLLCLTKALSSLVHHSLFSSDQPSSSRKW